MANRSGEEEKLPLGLQEFIHISLLEQYSDRQSMHLFVLRAFNNWLILSIILSRIGTNFFLGVQLIDNIRLVSGV